MSNDTTEIEVSSQTFLAAVKEQHKINRPLSFERLCQIKEELEGPAFGKGETPQGAGGVFKYYLAGILYSFWAMSRRFMKGTKK